MPNPPTIILTPWQAPNHVNMSNANGTRVHPGDTITYKATNTRATITFPTVFDEILVEGSGTYTVDQGAPRSFDVKSNALRGTFTYSATTENDGVSHRAVAGSDPSMIID